MYMYGKNGARKMIFFWLAEQCILNISLQITYSKSFEDGGQLRFIYT